ncbi:MAG: hypothetical protein NTX49_02900 [Chlamydiae bacterium]|nr:hypothetical protein [Chlamydiota bacterium]
MTITACESISSSEVENLFAKGKIFLDSSRLDKAFIVLQKCYDLALTSKMFKIAAEASLHLAEIYNKKRDFSSCRLSFIQGYDLTQGTPYAEALPLEQNEYAISRTAALGTTSIGECMALALYHPESKTIALAHIDVRTSAESIEALLSKMPDGKLEAHIIGGSADKLLRETSLGNLIKTEAALAKRKDITLEEHALDSPHTTAFVMDLEGRIHNDTIPSMESPHRFSRSGLASFSEESRPLRQAYSESDGRMVESPIEITEDVEKVLATYQPLNEDAIMKIYAGDRLSPSLFLAEEIIALRALQK